MASACSRAAARAAVVLKVAAALLTGKGDLIPLMTAASEAAAVAGRANSMAAAVVAAAIAEEVALATRMTPASPAAAAAAVQSLTHRQSRFSSPARTAEAMAR